MNSLKHKETMMIKQYDAKEKLIESHCFGDVI